MTGRIIVDDFMELVLANPSVQRMWAGTDYRHISFDHIQKLWQFVDAIFSKEFTHGSDSGVIASRLVRAIKTCGIAAIEHGPEFIDDEYAPT